MGAHGSEAELPPGGVPVTAQDKGRAEAPAGTGSSGGTRAGGRKAVSAALSRAVGETFLASIRAEANPYAAKSHSPFELRD